MTLFSSVNPYNSEINGEVVAFTSNQIESTLTQAENAFDRWKQSAFSERSQVLIAAADYLTSHKERLGMLITSEMGKVLTESIAEIEKCSWVCRYYAENGEAFLTDEKLPIDDHDARISYAPLGTVLAIMPWNFPFWQVFRFAAPAVMAGNSGLLKHASNVPLCAEAIEQVFLEAGLPEGVFQNMPVPSSEVADLIKDRRVVAVTLTGSEYAGSQVGKTAGENLKKTVLELGGSDPFIVLGDADITAAAEIAAKARMLNCGQSCIAAKRFIVVREKYDSFVEAFVSQVQALVHGDPTDPGSSYGPMARKDLAEALMEQVNRSIKSGASRMFDTSVVDSMFPANILTNVNPGMPAFDEELFGPVAAMIVAEDENDAVRLANRTTFGLGASLWTADPDRGQQLARQIESGSVFINKMVASHPAIPFGGIKMSGYGRELSHLGIREFVNQKSIVA